MQLQRLHGALLGSVDFTLLATAPSTTKKSHTVLRALGSRPIQPVCRILAMSIVILTVGDVEATTIVVPPELGNTEGNAHCCSGSAPQPGVRIQEIHSASEFAQMNPSPGMLTQLAFRPDKNVTAPRTLIWHDLELRLSTTNCGPGSMSSRFDDNFGTDTTVVYSGDLTMSTQAAGPSAGPRPFDYVIEFQQPFVYDPNDGNLIIDWRVSSIEGGPYMDGPRYYDELNRFLIALSPRATHAAGMYDAHSVVELTVVPLSASPADFDGDGDVDGDDFLTWQSGFGVDNRGDADNDGDTDGDDFLIWQTEFGSGSGTASAVVPEPASTMFVLVMAAIGTFSRRRGIRRMSC